MASKLCVLLLTLTSSLVYAQKPLDFNNSPLNWANSPLNFDNSPLNWANSPLNWANSPLNIHSTNGIYTPDGNRIGYVVPKPSGGANIFIDGQNAGYVAPPLVPLTPMFGR